MPYYAFWQPPSNPYPETWEFRGLVPLQGDWPDYEHPIDLWYTVDLDVYACGGEFRREWCVEQEALRIGDDLSLYDRQAIEACVAEEVSCHGASVDTAPIGNGWVQVRACDANGISCSDWSSATVVPEFDFFAGLLAGVLLVGALYERSRERRRTRAVRGLRVNRQRGPIRRWLRKMLHP